VTPDVCVYFCISDDSSSACVEYPPGTILEDVGFDNPGKTVTGPYSTVEECEASGCGYVYFCVYTDDVTASCVQYPIGTTLDDIVSLFPVTGPYSTIEECEAACGVVYFCRTEGDVSVCVEYPAGTTIDDIPPVDGTVFTGPYSTLLECQSLCGVVYFCLYGTDAPNDCVEYPAGTTVEEVQADHPSRDVAGPFDTIEECEASCSAECCTLPTIYEITLDEAVTTGFAENCDGFNNTWTTGSGTDYWEHEPTDPSYDVGCVGGGYGGAAYVHLWCNFPTNGSYYLEIVVDSVVVAEYTAPSLGWNCNGCNTMTLSNSPDGCCNFPNTLTVCGQVQA
jgi:hypothetical protein